MKGMNWQNDVSWVTVSSHRDSGRVGKERREMATAACQKLLELSTKIVAVGRNYAAHAKELGNAVPKVPFSSSLTIFFLFFIEYEFWSELCFPFSGASIVSETDVVLLEKWRNHPNPSQRGFSASRGRARRCHREESPWRAGILCHGFRCWYSLLLLNL